MVLYCSQHGAQSRSIVSAILVVNIQQRVRTFVAVSSISMAAEMLQSQCCALVSSYQAHRDKAIDGRRGCARCPRAGSEHLSEKIQDFEPPKQKRNLLAPQPWRVPETAATQIVYVVTVLLESNLRRNVYSCPQLAPLVKRQEPGLPKAEGSDPERLIRTSNTE